VSDTPADAVTLDVIAADLDAIERELTAIDAPAAEPAPLDEPPVWDAPSA
jgi:hypothetical protein